MIIDIVHRNNNLDFIRVEPLVTSIATPLRTVKWKLSNNLSFGDWRGVGGLTKKVIIRIPENGGEMILGGFDSRRLDNSLDFRNFIEKVLT